MFLQSELKVDVTLIVYSNHTRNTHINVLFSLMD